MKRLTHFNGGLYFDSEGYNRSNGETDKLGQIEDLMEKHNIPDLDSLEVLIDYGVKAYKAEQDAKTEELGRWREGKHE